MPFDPNAVHEVVALPISENLAGHIRDLVSQRGDSPAARGPMGDMEPAWVQSETEAMLYVVNEIRAGLGKDDAEIEDVCRAEYDAARLALGEGYEEDYARRLAALVLGD